MLKPQKINKIDKKINYSHLKSSILAGGGRLAVWVGAAIILACRCASQTKAGFNKPGAREGTKPSANQICLEANLDNQ